MRRKAAILLKAGQKALLKVKHIHHKNFYKGYSFPEVVGKAAVYPFKVGPRAALSRLKKEILRVSSVSSIKHHFPNGLVSGVDKAAIKHWIVEHKRRVTMVIPSYNDYDLLSVCVKSIHETCKSVPYEIIIVDDFCEEENRKKLRTLEDDKTRIVFREKNGGFAKAVNSGLAEVADGNDVILVNSDIEAHAGWFEALQYGAYEFGENVGIVGPKLLYPDGRIQSGGTYRNTEAPEWFDHYYRFQDKDYGPANVPYYCLAVTGACLYIKNDCFKAIGKKLDEGCEFAFDDVDICLEAWQKGYRSLYFPAATLTHHESATRAKNKTISEKERRSVVYFWEKWGDWFDKREVRNEKGEVRVIFVLQTLGWSGGIKIAVEHANRLKAMGGFAPEIWSLSEKSVWNIDVPTRAFRNYQQLVKALEGEDAIKVATWWETIFPVWLASIRHGIAVNFIQEIESWFYPDDPDAQRTVIANYRKEFKNMTTSGYNLDEIEQLGLKAEKIPCAYDDTVYKQLPGVKRQDNTLLAVGRTFFQKNFDFTFRAWRLLSDQRPNMWLFGSEPDMKALDSRITYHTKPTDEEVNELFNKATVFVQTSRHEGFSLPVLEAMAAGIPVITTDSHGNRDFTFDGKNCLIIDHDDDQALKKAYQKLFENPKLRAKLAKEGLKTVQSYTWPVVMQQVSGFYQQVATPTSILENVRSKYAAK